MKKRDRQQQLAELIRTRAVSTQAELVAGLKEAGFEVTQATVSRDMREIGVQKGIDAEGALRYVISPSRESRDPETVLARVLGDAAASATPACNLVVVRCEPGLAPAVGKAIDELGREEVIGTVAGDDTVMMALADGDKAREMAAYLSELSKQG